MKLKMRLLPLLPVEQALLHRLSLAGLGGLEANQLSYTDRGRAFLKEVSVNAAVRWKDAFTRSNKDWDRASFNTEDAINWDDPNDPGVVLHACSEDMIRLWNDPVVRKLLERQSLRPEEVAGL